MTIYFRTFMICRRRGAEVGRVPRVYVRNPIGPKNSEAGTAATIPFQGESRLRPSTGFARSRRASSLRENAPAAPATPV